MNEQTNCVYVFVCICARTICITCHPFIHLQTLQFHYVHFIDCKQNEIIELTAITKNSIENNNK